MADAASSSLARTSAKDRRAETLWQRRSSGPWYRAASNPKGERMNRSLWCMGLWAVLVLFGCGDEKKEAPPAASPASEPLEEATPVAEPETPKAQPEPERERRPARCPERGMIRALEPTIDVQLEMDGESLGASWDPELRYKPAGGAVRGPFVGFCGAVVHEEQGAEPTLRLHFALKTDSGKPFSISAMGLRGGKQVPKAFAGRFEAPKKGALDVIGFMQGSVTVTPSPLKGGPVKLVADLTGHNTPNHGAALEGLPPEMAARLAGNEFRLKLTVEGTFEELGAAQQAP